MNEETKQLLFFEVHSNLLRESPGSSQSTQKAISIIRQQLREEERLEILDIGCGVGPQTKDLAKGFNQARISALDSHQPYLETLNEKLEQGIQKQVTTYHGSMFDIHNIFRDKKFDVIWAEGKDLCSF